MIALAAENDPPGASASAYQWLGQLTLTVATASLMPLQAWRPPPQPAVALRGALGAALMDVACLRRDRDCGGCEWTSDCPIVTWYDPGRAGSGRPRPFALRVLEAAPRVSRESPLVVEWALFEPPPRPSLLLEGLCRAARLGLGRDRVPHRVERLVVRGEGASVTLLRGGEQQGAWPAPAPLVRFVRLPADPIGARVHLLTPVQLHGGRPPDAAELLRSAVGRVRALARTRGVSLNRWWPEPRGLSARWEGLRRVEGGRYSRRQAHRVDLSGWMGTLVLGPEVAAWADLLAAMEVLQIGRHTPAGLGRIAVEWQPA